MTTDTADLRVVQDPDGVHYVSLSDVAALLLDTAHTLDPHPEITAPAALRSLAAGIARYDPDQRRD